MLPINKSFNKGRVDDEIAHCRELIDRANRAVARNSKRIPPLEKKLDALKAAPQEIVLWACERGYYDKLIVVFLCPWPRPLSDDEIDDARPWQIHHSKDLLEEKSCKTIAEFDSEIERLAAKYNPVRVRRR